MTQATADKVDAAITAIMEKMGMDVMGDQEDHPEEHAEDRAFIRGQIEAVMSPTQTSTDVPEYFLMSEGPTDSRWFICHKAGNHVAGPYRTHQEASVEMEKLRVFVGSLAPTDYRPVNTQPWCKHGVGVRECAECAPTDCEVGHGRHASCTLCRADAPNEVPKAGRPID